MTPATDNGALKDLVMGIIQGEQDYEQLLTLLEPATQTPAGLGADTALTLALLLEEVETQAALNDQLDLLVNDEGAPALVLSESGVILAQNPAATSLFGATRGDSIRALGVRREEFSAFQQRIVQHDGPTLLRTYTDANAATPVMFIGVFQPRHQIFVLRAIECQWSASIDQALEDIFSLTAAERDILACLAQGMTSEQISQQRSRAVGTVRQQIKSVLAKLGASSQVQAAAMASAIASQPIRPTPAHASPEQVSEHPLHLHELVRDTRRVGWRRYGVPGGRPVLLLHGAYFGAGEHDPDRALAHQHGLDVVIVERPGYGRTQPPGKHEDPLDTQVKDFLAVMDHLQWDKALLKSHDFGFVPALALANAAPARVTGLLGISPPAPITDTDDLSHIPRQQRMFIWAAKHAFWMIRLLLRLGQVKARKYGPDHWMEMVFEGAPHELPVFEEPRGRKVAVGAYAFNLIQKSRGHELDMLVSVGRDWTPLLRQALIPITTLAGGKNTTFLPQTVDRLRQHSAVLSHETVESAGLTLCVTHSEECFRQL
jgi:pimeloyl-ACP methyl ester carboxylesterase/DNA-binding CsgD family transcriptional regulator